MKRILKILFIPFLVFIGLSVTIKFFLFPAAATFALNTLDQWTFKNLPAHIQAKELQVEVFPPRLLIGKMSITPLQDELKTYFKSAQIDQFRIEFNLFDLFFGQLQAAALIVQGLTSEVSLDPLLESKTPAQPLPMDLIFEWVKKSPLRQIILRSADVRLTAKKNTQKLELRKALVSLQTKKNKLVLDIDLPEIKAHYNHIQISNLFLKSKAVIEESSARIIHAQLGNSDLTLQATGAIENLRELPIAPQFTANVKLTAGLEQIQSFLDQNFPKVKAPQLSGDVDLTVQLQKNPKNSLGGTLEIGTKNVSVADFKIGDSHVQGKFDFEKVYLQEVSLKHPSGSAMVTNFQISLKAPFEYQSKIEVTSLDLQKLFIGLHLTKIPVWLSASGKFQCQGQFNDFQTHCDGEAQLPEFEVKASMSPTVTPIVKVKDVIAKGSVDITSKEVKYDSQLLFGAESGRTYGNIVYDKGFDIYYQTPGLNFQRIGKIAGLNFSGTASVDGWVRGDSSTAQFEMDLRAQDFSVNEFALGITSTHLRYNSGSLYFEDLQSSLARSEITGSLLVDLNQELLKGNFSSEKMNLSDIAIIFDKFYRFPLAVSGAGKASVSFDGPYEFWKLNSKIISHFQNGSIHGDRFDNLFFDVSSQKGNFSISRASVTKQDSRLDINGQISSNKDLDLKGTLKNLRLEDSQFISSVRQNVSGNLFATAALTGSISNPLFKTKGTLSELVADEQEIANSYFELNLSNKVFEGNLSLFGSKIQTDFRLPLLADSGPLQIRARSNNWSFSSILGLIGAAHLQNQYDSTVTGSVDLQSATGDVGKLEGKIEAEVLSLKRGPIWLKNIKPISISASAGNYDIHNFQLVGPSSEIQVKGSRFSLNNLNLSIFADLDLRLLHMLLPFLDDIGGPFKMNAAIKGAWNKPTLLGDAKIEGGFFKLKGFPHSLEKVTSQFIFSDNKVLIQNLKGMLASGAVRGEGTIQIHQIGDIPTQVRIKAEGLNLLVPDKVQTSGDADLLFSGNWFPFVLSGVYNVKQSLVEMEFDSAGGQQLKQSSYLPKILKKGNFDPVLLDIQVRLDKNCVIRNSQMEGSVFGNIHIKGPPMNPGILGKLQTDKGSKMIFKDKPFELSTGIVTFNSADEINPDLYIAAQSRISEYDVSVLIQGPSKTPTIRMSSVPPLPEQDLISLLALGITSAKLDQQIQSKDQANQLGYEALGMGLSKTGIKKGIETTTGLNFQIGSTYDTTKNISVPKMTLNKKITKKINASYSRTLGSEQTSSEMKLQFQINNSVSAVGSYEEREGSDSSAIRTTTGTKKSIFGLDLEFKREFK